MNDRQVMHAMSVDDSYHVERVLASSAYGVTELVTLDGAGPFVRKRIPTKLAQRVVWATIADCDCARLPHVEATYELPDEFVLVMDFVPGENLEQFVSSYGRLSEDEACELVCQISEAAAVLHERGLVHRDISPRNIIVAPDGAHLIDLGIARFRKDGAGRDTTQLGTWGFSSPEQYGFAQTDARSDIYSLGRILGYLLTGVFPDADDYAQLLSDDTVVSPRARAIVEQASAFEPGARYQSAEELAEALKRQEPVEDKQEPPSQTQKAPAVRTEPLANPRTRRARLHPAIVAALVVAAVAVAVLAWHLLGYGAQSATTQDADGGAATSASDETPISTSDDASGSTTSTPVQASGGYHDGDLEIVESGYTISANGYINYAFCLRNNSDVEIYRPSVSIVGRDENGQVVFSNSQAVVRLTAGQTVYFGFLAGNGNVPATVEFKVNEPSDDKILAVAGTSPIFSLSGVRTVQSAFANDTLIVGEVTTVAEGDSSDTYRSVALTVVFRDESGAIVYGDVSFVDMPVVGESAAFEISSVGVPSNYASFEVYAQEWR